MAPSIIANINNNNNNSNYITLNNLKLKETTDIYNAIFNPKEREGRYFIISKNDYENTIDDVHMFDMKVLELYPIELSMEYLAEKYPTYNKHYFLLIRDWKYYLFDKDCRWLKGIEPIINFKNQKQT